MKRMIAWALCAILMLTCFQALAETTESDYTYYPESEDFVGEWYAGDYELEIVHMLDDYTLFSCIVSRYDADGINGERWIYDTCAYDGIGEALTDPGTGMRFTIVLDENGDLVSNEQIYDDGSASFALDDEGRLIWTDFKETPGENEIVFERAAKGNGKATADVIHSSIQHVTDSPEWIVNLPAAKEAEQLFVVAGLGMDLTTATVSMHEKNAEGNWQQILSTPGYVGKNGLCLDQDHVEGCGQTPVGVYHFNKAFGIAADPGCAIPYIQVDDDTYWSGDPNQRYNEMVDIKDYPDLLMDDSEHIVDYEYQYQYCLNISFNEDGTPGRGSAIFLHCLGPVKPYTGGCVAIPENIMKLVMQNVREDCVVVIDTLENMGGSF